MSSDLAPKLRTQQSSPLEAPLFQRTCGGLIFGRGARRMLCNSKCRIFGAKNDCATVLAFLAHLLVDVVSCVMYGLPRCSVQDYDLRFCGFRLNSLGEGIFNSFGIEEGRGDGGGVPQHGTVVEKTQ